MQRLEFLATALDTSDWEEFDRWCERFGPRAGVLKVGLEAYVRWGSRAVERALETGAEVFLDLKLHDIPNTVAGAMRAARELNIGYLTVHAGGGPRMLEAAVEAAAGGPRVLAVTLLTHLDEPELHKLDLPGEPRQRVARWAQLAVASGCGGLVCSPLEVAELRTSVPDAFRLVTPGIRLGGRSELDDQRRVASPRQALKDGADLLVVGRPLTHAEDPESVLERLAEAGESRPTR